MLNRCCLWVLCSLIFTSAWAQPTRMDSLGQRLRQTPDSLQAPVLMEMAWEYMRQAEESPAMQNQGMEAALEAQRMSQKMRDTATWIDAIWFQRQYHLQTGQAGLAEELDSTHQQLRAHYGYHIEDEYNWWNGLGGYRFNHIYNTLFILDDPEGNLSIDQVASREMHDAFRRNQTTTEDLSDPDLVHWVRLRLRGHPEEDGDYLFMVGSDSYTWQDIQVYVPQALGGFSIQRTGSSLLPEDKSVQDWRSFFRVQLPAGGDKTIYLRLKTPNNITIPSKVFINHMNETYMNETAQQSRFNNGIFMGILWVQGVYFLLLFLSVRDKSYFFYVIYILALALLVMAGLYYNRFFPRQGEYKMFIYLIVLWMAAFGMLRFTDSYLNLKEVLPKGRRLVWIFKVLYAVVGFIAIIMLGFDYQLNQRFSRDLINTLSQFIGNAYVFLIPIGLILIMIVGVMAMRKRYSPARYFLIANTFLILGVGIPFVLLLFNLQGVSFQKTMLSAQIGVVLQLSFFALGVGHKQKLLESEKRDALQKNLELEHEANEKLRQADKLKDEFLANTSHELRTPLNGIIGIAEALYAGAAKDDPQKMEENLSVIINSGRRLNTLVNDLLDFSKLRNYDIDLQLKPIDLAGLTKVVLTLCEQLMRGKTLALHHDIPEDLPAVWADENRLQQILYNLVGNAIKFTPEGSVTVSARHKGDFVEIRVTDTGIGIPEDKQARIFEQFEQADGSIAREYGGTGLGLSITKKLIELHGGEIWVSSKEGEGSTFYFTIEVSPNPAAALSPTLSPLQREIAHVALPRQEEMPDAASLALLPTTGGNGVKNKSVKILVVDDEPVNQQVMKNLLSLEKGYLVATAVNGKEALEALEKESYDLVLLDIMMPKMSGFEVCEKIREKFLPNELPVIMVTAKNQVSDLVAGLSHGANDYIAKPFSREELLARIKTHLYLFNINTAYGRFVPHEFIKSLGLKTIMDAQLGDGVEREFTVLFADIRSYTTLAENMTPKENFDFLIAYLGRLGPVIQAYGGFVNQYYGDGVMALFPEAENGVQAGIEIQQSLAAYNRNRIEKGRKPVYTGVGLHTGQLLLGIIGDETRFDAAVVSDTVNTAARMEGLTKYYGASLLVSADTLMAIAHPEKLRYRYLGRVLVKGKKEPIGIYDIIDADAEAVARLKMDSLDDFEHGLRFYYEQNFEAARAAFARVLDIHPGDKAARLYFDNCARFVADGVPEGWEGVEMMMSK